MTIQPNFTEDRE